MALVHGFRPVGVSISLATSVLQTVCLFSSLLTTAAAGHFLLTARTSQPPICSNAGSARRSSTCGSSLIWNCSVSGTIRVYWGCFKLPFDSKYLALRPASRARWL